MGTRLTMGKECDEYRIKASLTSPAQIPDPYLDTDKMLLCFTIVTALVLTLKPLAKVTVALG